MQKAKHLFPFLAAIALASCTGAEEGAPADGGGSGDAVADAASEIALSGEETIAMAGTAWLSVGTDGAVQRTLIDEGGRYRDIRNGELFGEGSWEQRPDGKVCFEPDTGLGACWQTESADADGTVIATNDDDRRIELKRVTYTAPETAEDDSAS